MTHRTTRRSRSTVFAALLIIGTLPLGLTACSSGSDASTAKNATAGVGAAWGSCMRDAGFNVQDPTDAQVESGVMQAPPGSDREEFVRVGAACSRKVGVKGSSSADQQKWEREYAKVASCIREDYPDLPEQQPGVLNFGSYERSQEPGFQKAAEACMQRYAPDTQMQNAG